jgi:hypothetical protein
MGKIAKSASKLSFYQSLGSHKLPLFSQSSFANHRKYIACMQEVVGLLLGHKVFWRFQVRFA